ncbi:MAG: PIN domain-containing protein [Ardenticatenaceae bacterium]|nr:PIN domain-containing protein [Ardenticatenaceae bacterium]
MTAKVMLDTNLWVYLYAQNVPEKQKPIQAIVATQFEAIILSAQILGELYYVLTRKKLTTTAVAREIILEMVTSFPVLGIDTVKVLLALDMHAKYGYSYWDSLILATASLHDCDTLYSEDMQHKQVIENKVQIFNPFAAA